MDDLVATFIYFFAIIDPIGTVPVFIAVTRHHDAGARKRVALTATAVAAVVLLGFVAVGELILTAMKIELSAFQIAGGIVLFLFALSMIFGESKPEREVGLAATEAETAIFPLAIPSIAGPGAMLTAVLLTENARFHLFDQALTSAVMLSVLVLTLLFMLAASSIHRLIGDIGATIISRVMGLVLAAAATSSTLGGIKAYFAL